MVAGGINTRDQDLESTELSAISVISWDGGQAPDWAFGVAYINELVYEIRL